jgi:hypothetical protein
MTLPRLDIPIGFVEWEVFVPDRYRARVAGGNVIARTAFPGLADLRAGPGRTSQVRVSAGAVDVTLDPRSGTVTGLVRDAIGAVLPGVTVELTSPVLIEKVRSIVTDNAGAFRVTSLPPGVYVLTLMLEGFVTARHENVLVTGGTITTVTSVLSLAGITETITVTAEAPVVDVQSAARRIVIQGATVADRPSREPSVEDLAAIPSQNVVDLQTRAAGVLPVRVAVPRAGTAHKFVRPLVVQDETVVMLRYRRR